ncbi:MAG TPA: type II 3-dehydroquinate dehydratase [Bacteroidales bacterium]|nr:type II 3-dehydroquinate dehydratase [Bacteroidales bacterium]HSA44734.1 type II 3-dehydroquinate dehydratase [Bacteroidales bacterium]
MKKIGIINGPNLNLTGSREPEVYGHTGFEELMARLRKLYPEIVFHYFQSNIEGEIIDCIHQWAAEMDAMVLNAGAYTHTSIAIGDAVRAISLPVIEVHLSNVFAREAFRQLSHIAPAAAGTITGLGMDSYVLAVYYLACVMDQSAGCGEQFKP